MPAYCKPPDPEKKESAPETPPRDRLPEPSKPPWLYSWTSPDSFYDPLFVRPQRTD